jgi:peptidoglycan hydrolase CwlO-like protein
MCKKVLVAALAVVVGLAVIKGTWLGSHFRAWKNRAGAWAKRQVKPETEIQRLRHEVQRLDEEDSRWFDKVARQRIEVRHLEEKVKANKAELAVLHERIGKLNAALKEDLQQVSYNGLTFSRVDAQRQMDLDFNRYRPLKKTVEGQEKYLTALHKALQQNEEKLFSLRQVRQDMLTQLQELETELAQLRQAKNVDKALLDTSNYTRVQKDIESLKRRLEEEKEKLKLRGILDKGPIERAEEAKKRVAARQAEIDAEVPAAPLAS